MSGRSRRPLRRYRNRLPPMQAANAAPVQAANAATVQAANAAPVQAANAATVQAPEVLSQADRGVLVRVQELLKFMSGDEIRELYGKIETRERTGLCIGMVVEKVPNTELMMLNPPTGPGQPPDIENVTPDMVRRHSLTIPVVEIKYMTVVEGGKAQEIPRISPYFFQSSGKSRGTGTKDMWLPSGDVHVKFEIVSVRYSKLEDEILSTVTAILDRQERLDSTKEEYPTLYPQFKDEFPTWDALMQSILKYGRFISETNALISYKLFQLYGASGARAEGRKVTKPKKKKGRKTLKASKGKGKGTLRGKPRSKIKNKK